MRCSLFIKHDTHSYTVFKHESKKAGLQNHLGAKCRISYQTCGDHLLKPFGLSLVVEVDAAHKIISCAVKKKKQMGPLNNKVAVQ